MKLSTFFTLQEFLVSETGERLGIDNTPPPAVLERLKFTARMLDGVRSLLGKPVIITSGYRSPALNLAVGGSKTSQHMRGEAADFICPGFGAPIDVCRAIAEPRDGIEVPFDQLIYEHSWVHISFVENRAPRREVLTLRRGGGFAVGLLA
jgi:zinc D-Ala-D-Ala carboxypeptidase